jgi:hypothetical protein
MGKKISEEPLTHDTMMRLIDEAGKEGRRAESRRRKIKQSEPYLERMRDAKEVKAKIFKLADDILRQNPAVGISLTQLILIKMGKDAPHRRTIQRHVKDYKRRLKERTTD